MLLFFDDHIVGVSLINVVVNEVAYDDGGDGDDARNAFMHAKDKTSKHDEIKMVGRVVMEKCVWRS